MNNVPSDFLKRMHEAIDNLDKARVLMANGPLDYYLKKLVCHSDALMTRFAPIKAGERARIIKPIKCENGWKGAERNLAMHGLGEVIEVDYNEKGFYYTFVPDVQMYYSSTDHEWKPTQRSSSYCLREEYLVMTTEPKKEVADVATT